MAGGDLFYIWFFRRFLVLKLWTFILGYVYKRVFIRWCWFKLDVHLFLNLVIGVSWLLIFIKSFQCCNNGFLFLEQVSFCASTNGINERFIGAVIADVTMFRDYVVLNFLLWKCEILIHINLIQLIVYRFVERVKSLRFKERFVVDVPNMDSKRRLNLTVLEARPAGHLVKFQPAMAFELLKHLGGASYPCEIVYLISIHKTSIASIRCCRYGDRIFNVAKVNLISFSLRIGVIDKFLLPLKSVLRQLQQLWLHQAFQSGIILLLDHDFIFNDSFYVLSEHVPAHVKQAL